MKEFYRNYVCRPTETEKKGRRVKNQQKESCRCFVPFVKLHYYDCPAVKKSCPVHKSIRHRGVKDEKGEVGQNMIISFHPSSKTERLFQPVKTLLAQCDPDTKVNLQYYSPKSTTSKESIKLQQVHTKSDDGRKSLNSNAFVEKTKSFVSDKTNKMKKLKQCFYSPCNSIAQKSRSQTSIKEKLNDIFRDERKKMSDFGNYVPDKPPDDIKNNSNLMWFSNRFDFKDWEKLSAEKTDSDFITVTQQAKKNLINHKIFEIKHKKGLNDIPFFKLPKQNTQLVYSTLDVNGSAKETRDFANPLARRYTVKDSIRPREDSAEIENKQKGDEELSITNSHASSSSSVYFTPVIFVPTAATDSDSDIKAQPLVSDETVPIKDGKQQKGYAQETQTPSYLSEKNSSVVKDSKTRSVQLQTDQSGDSANQEWYHRYTEMAESFTTRGTQTDEVFFPLESNLMNDSSESFAVATQIYSDEKQTATSMNSVDFKTSKGKNIVVPKTSNYVSEESVVTTTRFTMTTTTTDKRCQTESVKTQEVYKRRSFKINRSQTPITELSNKSTQTTFSLSESHEEDSEFIVLDSSNVTYVVKPFKNQESDQAIDKLAKAWWGKSHSDSELCCSKRCSCLKPEESIPLPHICLCQPSGAPRDTVTPKDQQTTNAQTPRKSVAPTSGGKVDRGQGTTSEVPFRPETPKADKSIGTNSGGHRLYKRADKALGTDSIVDLVPETPRKVDRIIATSAESKENRVPASTTSSKVNKSPRTVEFVSRAEQTSFKQENPHSPVSDLSELTRIIQEFFEKSGMKAFQSCNCETQTASEKKSDIKTNPTDSAKLKKDFAGGVSDTPAVKEKKVILDAPTNVSRKPQRERTNAEVPSTTKDEYGANKLDNRDSDRVKIRRSVLLDDSQTKTRFVCSLCAREISIFSINAATNTESPYTSRKKENTASVSAEISEVVKLKTTRTVQSLDAPKRFTSTPESGSERYNDAKGRISAGTYKLSQESPRPACKNFIPTPRQGPVAPSCQNSQTAKPESLKQASVPNTTRTATTTVTTTTKTITPTGAPTTSNVSKPPILKGCICDDVEQIFILHTCPDFKKNSNAASTSKGPSQKTDFRQSEPKPDYSGTPTNQSRSVRRSGDRSRSQRRNPESCYPALIRLQWPRELAFNASDKPKNVLGDSRSTSQQKRSYEKDTEPTDTPAGKKIRAEVEKPSRHCFMFAEPAFSDFRVDSKIFSSKRGFYWVPSFSASHVSPPKKHTLTQSKTIKSEESMRGPSQSMCQEKFSFDGSSDLSSTKSCHPTSITLGCHDQQPFEKLFECRLGKSLTFIKSNKDDVMLPLPLGLIAYRPEAPEDQSSTGQNDDDHSESSVVGDSSTQNLEKLLEECAKFSVRSGSPSTEELVEEDIGAASEEEPEPKSQSPENSSLLDNILRTYDDTLRRYHHPLG